MQEHPGTAEEGDLVQELPRAYSGKDNRYRSWKRRIGVYNELW